MIVYSWVVREKIKHKKTGEEKEQEFFFLSKYHAQRKKFDLEGDFDYKRKGRTHTQKVVMESLL